MNPKILRYGLIAGVVLVWGMIIQQVFSAMGDDNKAVAAPLMDTAALTGLPVDTFSLLLNYSDPFIPVEDTVEIIDTVKTVAAVVITPPPPEPKPAIKYLGMITNKEKKTMVGIINFEGHDMMVQEGQDVEDITIKKIKAGMLSFIFRNKIYSVQKTNQ